jgi:glyoxalase family protein
MEETEMPQPIVGLHHVTAIASDPQRILDFYVQVMGLRFVKRTVNFDDPGSFHFYLGDDAGSPGTILTFFAWPNATRGSVGIGETSTVAFSAHASSLDFWRQRLLSAGVPVEDAGIRFGDRVISFGDPDGMRVEIIGTENVPTMQKPRTSDVPQEYSICGFHSVTLSEAGFDSTARVLTAMGFGKTEEENNRIRFATESDAPGRWIDIVVQPQLRFGKLGAGTVHHIAFRAPSDASQLEWREMLAGISLHVTAVLDRSYFHSIYFREPGGVLFEIATDPPGFGIDEPPESLGEALKLPPWLEGERARIEEALPPIEMPYPKAGSRHE